MCSNLCAENRWTHISKFTTLSLVLKTPHRDVVLLVKPCMGSEELAQAPEVCFSVRRFELFNGAPGLCKFAAPGTSLAMAKS